MSFVAILWIPISCAGTYEYCSLCYALQDMKAVEDWVVLVRDMRVKLENEVSSGKSGISVS